MKSKHTLSMILIIVFAGLLTACDPIAYPYLSADRIIMVDDTAYLHVSERASWGIGYVVEDVDHYFISEDHGETWREIDSPPTEMPPPIEDSEAARLIACVPNDPRTCYRIVGKEQVEISNDGGNTWQIDWKMPPGRRKYMAKNPTITPFFGIEPDTVPYDLGIISEDDQHAVIAAMGNQGVLVKSIDGNWERYAVSPAESNRLAIPLPFYAASFRDAELALRTETTWTFLAAFIFLVSLSFAGWRKLYSNVEKDARSKVLWAGAPFILATAGFLCLIVLLVVGLFAPIFLEIPVGLEEFSYNLSQAICLIPLIGLIISWMAVAVFSPNRKRGFLATAITLGYTLIFMAGVLLPFGLWAYGIIPYYEIALVAACIFSLLSIVFGYRHVRQMATLAADQNSNQAK